MNEWDQRLAIAEAVGWKPSDGDIVSSKVWGEITGQYCHPYPPDYVNDLNLMREAETTLFPVNVWQLNEPDRWLEYHDRLRVACVGNAGGPIRATAPQRAEAFLKTIGKWQDHRPANASSCDSQPPAPS